jgi:hypothetical protein
MHRISTHTHKHINTHTNTSTHTSAYASGAWLVPEERMNECGRMSMGERMNE